MMGGEIRRHMWVLSPWGGENKRVDFIPKIGLFLDHRFVVHCYNKSVMDM